MNFFSRPTQELNPIIELFVGPLLGVLIIFFIISIVLIISFIVGRIKLFKKCGQAGWKAIIPFYGTYIQDVKIAGLHWSFFVLEEIWGFGLYSSILIIIVKIMSFYNLAKKFHKEPTASVIFGSIFSGAVTMIYGFSSSYIYDDKEPVSKCGIFGSILK